MNWSFISRHRQAAFITLIAIALQIQASVFVHQDYLGLRINLADLILPFSGLYIIITLLRGKSIWPQWNTSYIWPWCIGLVTIMTIALINGYLTNGFWAQWAWLNKYIGFITLVCYLALGGWIKTNFIKKDPERSFIISFSIFLALVLLMSFISYASHFIIKTPEGLGAFTWDGFMANRNALMLCLTFSLIALETYIILSPSKILGLISGILWLLTPSFALYNASRTGWIMTSLTLLFLAKTNGGRLFKKIIPLILIGSSLTYILFNYLTFGEANQLKQYTFFVAALEQDVTYNGDKNRFIALEDGLDLYQSSNPIIGSGLGSYKEFQKEKRGEYINLIDFSALWLLTETGALGIIGFSGFFICCLWTLFKTGIQEKQPFATTMFFFLLAMIAMSFLHELLYTRFLWFGLGLALARPAQK